MVTKKGTWGGKREGSGRKGLGRGGEKGTVTKAFSLTPKHVKLLETYAKRHGLTSTSEALRLMIEEAS